jgi:two-component system chemotaxis response regulator CheY
LLPIKEARMLNTTQQMRSSSPRPAGKGVLLIDDSRLFQRTTRKLAEQEGGYIMGVAESGASGAEMARNLKPDVIILDHNMPDMDGVECLRAIRERDAEVKVIVCSGELTAGLSQDYARLHIDALFTKPVALHSFLLALRKCLGESLEQELQEV